MGILDVITAWEKQESTQSNYRVCIGFSGLVIKFVFPNYIDLPDEFTSLLCDGCDSPDEEFEIRLLTSPLNVSETPVYIYNGTEIYRTNEGVLRIYSALTAKDGCQTACLIRPDGKNILYYPASRWEYYSAPLRCFHLICGETLLIRHEAFLLHSSVVMCDGKTVLFSGPSGRGKSTQAALWQKHLNADIINGDRCVIMKKDAIFYGGGSPWCGTSGIRQSEQAPIAGIFLIEQASENRVQRLGAQAFAPILTQATVNSWDTEFMNKITLMTAELIEQIPVYRLFCRPDKEAVMLGYRTLFGKDAQL